MTAIVKEEMVMENAATNYLQMYMDHINGYKQYKMERKALSRQTTEPAEINEKPASDAFYYSDNKSG